MTTVLVAARLILAAVLAVAGAGKLADLEGSRAAAAAFGIPQRYAIAAGTALPVIELATAGALLPAASASIGAVAALILLAAFVAAISRSMLRGEAPDCHCFGAIHSEPAGWSTLVRDLMLAAIAVLVVVGSRGRTAVSATSWLTHVSSATIDAAVYAGAAVGFAALVAMTLLALLRQNGRLMIRIDELELRLEQGGVSRPTPRERRAGIAVGEPAPAFAVRGLTAEIVTLGTLIASTGPIVLLFTDPNCRPCRALMPQVGRWQREHDRALTVAILSRGTADATLETAREYGLTDVLLDEGGLVHDAYRVSGTPGAVLIDARGRIGSPVVAGADAIGDLVREATETAPSRLQIVSGLHGTSPLPAVKKISTRS